MTQVRSWKVDWKIDKPNNFKILGSNKIKVPKQDSQNQLRSPMSDGGDP
jgi:hypothetical protein